MLATYLKLAACKAAATIPGPHQEKFETRYLWAQRTIRARSSTDDFATELARLGADSVCIDLGANIGSVTAVLARHAGHVHAFEPEPWAFEQLEKNTRDLPNVTLHKAAAGTSDGVVQFHLDPDFDKKPEIHSQGTSMYSSLLWDDTKEAPTFEARIVDFRRFIRELCRRVSLVKIDIEGAEVDLLEALVGTPEWDMIDAVFVETHECQIKELRERTARRRNSLKGVSKPRVYLDWH